MFCSKLYCVHLLLVCVCVCVCVMYTMFVVHWLNYVYTCGRYFLSCVYTLTAFIIESLMLPPSSSLPPFPPPLLLPLSAVVVTFSNQLYTFSENETILISITAEPPPTNDIIFTVTISNAGTRYIHRLYRDDHGPLSS